MAGRSETSRSGETTIVFSTYHIHRLTSPHSSSHCDHTSIRPLDLPRRKNMSSDTYESKLVQFLPIGCPFSSGDNSDHEEKLRNKLNIQDNSTFTATTRTVCQGFRRKMAGHRCDLSSLARCQRRRRRGSANGKAGRTG